MTTHSVETLRVARAERIKRILIVFIAASVTIVLMLAGLLFVRQAQTITEIRATQQEGSPSSKRIIALSNLIAGCVTPGDTCYDDGQKRTADAVESITTSIGTITAITVACGDQAGQQTVTQIRACVTKQLADLPKEN